MMLPSILARFPRTAICLVELIVLFLISPRYPLICSQLVVVSIQRSTAFTFEKVVHVCSRKPPFRLAIETSCYKLLEVTFCGAKMLIFWTWCMGFCWIQPVEKKHVALCLDFGLLYVTPACHLRFSNPYR